MRSATPEFACEVAVSASNPPEDAEQGSATPAASSGGEPHAAQATMVGIVLVVCSNCGSVLDQQSQFCQSCGAQRLAPGEGGEASSPAEAGAAIAAPAAEKSPDWLPLLNIVWLVFMIVALVVLFSFLFGIGF